MQLGAGKPCRSDSPCPSESERLLLLQRKALQGQPTGRTHEVIKSDKYVTKFPFKRLEKKVVFSVAGFYHRFLDISGLPEVFCGVGKTHTSKPILGRNEQERSGTKRALGRFFSCLFQMRGINVFTYVSNQKICITLFKIRRKKTPA